VIQRPLQREAAHPGVPRPLPVPVAVPGPLRGALVSLGPQPLAPLQLPQRLRQHPHPVSEELRVPGELGLAQPEL
jgi:hypothetical protein